MSTGKGEHSWKTSVSQRRIQFGIAKCSTLVAWGASGWSWMYRSGIQERIQKEVRVGNIIEFAFIYYVAMNVIWHTVNETQLEICWISSSRKCTSLIAIDMDLTVLGPSALFSDIMRFWGAKAILHPLATAERTMPTSRGQRRRKMERARIPAGITKIPWTGYSCTFFLNGINKPPNLIHY